MPTSNSDNEGANKPISQWAWFVGLWLGGVIAVGSVSLLLRSILLP